MEAIFGCCSARKKPPPRTDEEVEAAALKVQTAMRAAAVRKEASQKARRNSHTWTSGEWTAEL